MKLCITCAHYQARRQSCAKNPFPQGEPNPVNGYTEPTYYKGCSSMRLAGAQCDKEGKQWEPMTGRFQDWRVAVRVFWSALL